jgi:membrane protein DedA with SNARE-associated domain
LFVGFFLPGETAVILGGVLAYRHTVSLPLMAVVVGLAAVAGDSAGYEVGHRYGTRLLATRILRRHSQALTTAQITLRRNAGRAVFLARFTAFLRAVMPALAGTAKVPYRRFLAFNAAGGLTWGIGYTLLGYLAGASYKTVESYASYAGYIFLAAVIIAATTIAVRRHHTESGAQPPGLMTPDS